MKKSFKIIHRITGISCPIFGISWDPSKTDRDKIRSLITFLEDRRVLYNPFNSEVSIWMSESIIEIRKKLTDIVSDFKEDTEATQIIRTMRSSCRKYLDRTYKHQKKGLINRTIIENLIELRSVFGLCIGKLSIMFGIDIEESLAEIIPVLDDDDGKEYRFDNKKQRIY